MQKPIGKTRKLLVIVATCIFCITCVAWWWLMYSRNKSRTEAENIKQQQAFNTRLPNANAKEIGKNKLEIYMQAQKDSAKLKEMQQKDTSQKRWFDPGPPDNDVFADEYPPQAQKKKAPHLSANTMDPNEKKVNDRLEKLYAALNTTQPVAKPEELFPDQTATGQTKTDIGIAQLEKLLMTMKSDDSTADPEMKQLETLLDKIMDIQHPGRIKEQLKQTLSKGPENNFTITTAQRNSDTIGIAGNNTDNSFYGLQDITDPALVEVGNSILAVIHDDQKIQDGQNLKFRLLQNIFINNQVIPKDLFVFGKCSLTDGRVNVTIENISFNNIIYPVQLTVYDYSDGMEGINVQGDVTEEVTKSGIDQLTQQMQLNALNPTLAAQAATTGIQTAQNLLRKKIKKIRVLMKSGHKVILKLKSAS